VLAARCGEDAVLAYSQSCDISHTAASQTMYVKDVHRPVSLQGMGDGEWQES